MSEYFVLSSRDPFNHDMRSMIDWLSELRASGSKVTLFLVENGVLHARQSGLAKTLEDLAKVGVEVLADDFSLSERGIRPEEMTPSVKVASVDRVVDAMETNCKTFWH